MKHLYLYAEYHDFKCILKFKNRSPSKLNTWTAGWVIEDGSLTKIYGPARNNVSYYTATFYGKNIIEHKLDSDDQIITKFFNIIL